MDYKRLSRITDSWYDGPAMSQIDRWFGMYVPSTGIAPTVGGEIVRAFSRITYRYYNDGDMVGIGYGNETCNGSNRYLVAKVPGYIDMFGHEFDVPEDVYERELVENADVIVGYLDDHPELFEKKNTEDSRPCTQEDRDLERQQEEEYYENGDEDW